MHCMDSVEVRKISKITAISLIHCYNTQSDMFFSDSGSDSLFNKFYNKESVSKAVSIQT